MSSASGLDELPFVSVVTPAYNQAQFLRETIESVLTQDYPRIEYRVIDDGSTDATRSILEEYDGRILWDSRPNRGQTATINQGWEQCTGDILIWLNSDDTFLPGAVRSAVDYLRARPEVGIVFGDSLFTEADGTPLHRSRDCGAFDYRRFVLECENPICQPSAFLRRSVVEDVGPLDPYYFYFMDWDYWLRSGLRHRIEHHPELWSTYRLHAASNTVAQAKRVAPELERMYGRFFERADLPDWARARRDEATANMWFTTAGYYSKGGAHDLAAEAGKAAQRAYPALTRDPRMLRKWAFCRYGNHPVYRAGRSLLRRIRTKPSPKGPLHAADASRGRSTTIS